jgi:hypothetical protein
MPTVSLLAHIFGNKTALLVLHQGGIHIDLQLGKN